MAVKKFNIMGIVLMMVAVGVGSFFGASVASWFGMAGGLIGSLIVGFIVYAIWAILSGAKIKLWAGLIFAIMVWLANLLASAIQGATGFGGGILGLGIVAIIASFLWANFGAGMAGQATIGKTKKKSRRKR